MIPELRYAGLNAIEAYHSDHGLAETQFYVALAEASQATRNRRI